MNIQDYSENVLNFHEIYNEGEVINKLSEEFKLVMVSRLTGNSQYIISDLYKVAIKVRKGGYTPKSAFIVIDSLRQFNFKGKDVLDLGCGETGMLAHYAFLRKANSVVGVDIDPAAIMHAENCSNYSNNILWFVSNVFSNIMDNNFDIILSNPPQMPIKQEGCQKLKDWHDSCGHTGREMIIQILKEGHKYLNKAGEIFILMFDFLGIIERTNNQSSIYEIAIDLGYECEIIEKHSKLVRKGGFTEKNIPWIKKIYPFYIFKENELGKFYDVSVVHFKLN